MMEQYIENEPPPFEFITENVYLDDTGSSRDKKKAKKMVCECQFDPGVLYGIHNMIVFNNNCFRNSLNKMCYCLSRMYVELDDPDTACGEDCLNRLLLIEWYGHFIGYRSFVCLFVSNLFTKSVHLCMQTANI